MLVNRFGVSWDWVISLHVDKPCLKRGGVSCKENTWMKSDTYEEWNTSWWYLLQYNTLIILIIIAEGILTEATLYNI